MPFVDLYGGGYSLSQEGVTFDPQSPVYCGVHASLLPDGDAWVLDPEGETAALLCGLGLEFSRVEIRARRIIEENDSRSTEELLADWEADIGLPATCEGGNPPVTLAARQSALHSKLTHRPSGNAPFFLGLADNLGYPAAQIATYGDPFLCTDPCTDGLYGLEGGWLFYWELLTNELAGGENDATLSCLVRDYAQAHEEVSTVFD